MKALLIVDVQNDFCPGGALAVKDGDQVVPILNGLMNHFPLVVASRDWHPEGTVHYERWPVHCLQNTYGADYHPLLNRKGIHQEFFKGTGNKDDGYSAFDATNINLKSYLRSRNFDELIVGGLATDYCVKATALDAVRLGFKTTVLTDAVRAVDVHPGDGEKAMHEMSQQGVAFTLSTDLL